MNLRLLAKPLLATGLLLSTLGCSKKDEPAASAMGTYQLDNTTISCQATAATNTSTSNGITFDYLTIDLATTPQPSVGAASLRLYFINAQSNNTYILNAISLKEGNNGPYYFSVDAATISTTSSGGYSGTFSGKIITSAGAPGAPYTTITNGKFTNVRP